MVAYQAACQRERPAAIVVVGDPDGGLRRSSPDSPPPLWDGHDRAARRREPQGQDLTGDREIAPVGTGDARLRGRRASRR